jgi:transcriptional regulator with XRE-family HTH domain
VTRRLTSAVAERAERPNVEDEQEDASYLRRVGLRIRDVRRSKRLSLHDVEADSNKEFKASVLGAYERGERAISVPRLQRLATFYGVPVDRLLPPVVTVAANDVIDLEALDQSTPLPGITIDLSKLESDQSRDALLVARYISGIRLQRRVQAPVNMTIRRSDLTTLAALLEVSEDIIQMRLGLLGLALSR